MKLIVAGSTGFVATEIIRQAISNPSITSVIALARRETIAPIGNSSSKFKSVVCDDFSNYSDSVKKELTGADACIWTIAITPSKVKSMPFAEVRKICHDYTVTGIETMSPLAAKPFRFIYMSGVNGERDQSKRPWILADMSLMRGKTESMVLDHAKDSKGAVEACVAKPGLIDAPGGMGFVRDMGRMVLRTVVGLPKVEVGQVAATLIDQAINGFETDTLLNEDLVSMGAKLLGEGKTTEI